MTNFKKLCALVLALMIIVTAGIVSVSAAQTDDNSEVAADNNPGSITIHVRDDDTTQPYVYLWNSLPTNSAMSKSYPGEKMTKSGEWFDYVVNDVTKVNAIVTDANGNQYSSEKMLTLTADASGEWWCDNGKWTKYDPDEPDPVSSVDMREESIYFVMTTRFYDGDTGNNVHCWDDGQANNPDSDPAWRGDFKGLAEKLDYIKALGFSAIWITPVVTNASGYDYHGYHAMDFSTVDVRYESDDFTFDDLIKAVHQKGMKIIQDVVWQHTGNFGEEYFCKLFEKDTTADLSKIEESMIPTDTLLDRWGLSSAEEYWAQPGGVQHAQRIQIMKENNIEASNFKDFDNNATSLYDRFAQGIEYDKQQPDRISHSSVDNVNNYYHNSYWRNYNWDDYATQYSQIAGDCVDLNTENPEVAERLVDIYSSYINRGVDAFRVDTLRHMSRLSLNAMFNDQLNKVGGDGFFMFGEACTRYTDVWYRGMAGESAPFYTWDEPDSKYLDQWNWDGSNEAIGENMNLTLDHWLEYIDPSDQPTSDNAFLKGIDYHTPDYAQASGMSVIDFAMHWNFGSADGAFGVAKSGDKYYNDATWNVVYVDSHDYGPGTESRFGGGSQAWAENMNLMFTFRGIPCVYYGSEAEFQKGVVMDVGPKAPLSTTGRAYYGDYLEGNVTATDFSEYSASGTVADTLDMPLAKHLQKLNAIRRAIPALQKGQYTTNSSYVSGNMAYIRRYTDDSTDSLACVTVSGGATFKNIPNGTYIDAVTGDIQNVSNGTLTVPSIGKANMRVYVCCASGFTGISGAIGGTSSFLK